MKQSLRRLRALALGFRIPGKGVECELCASKVRRFVKIRPGWPVRCPVCGSLPRQRLAWWYLRQEGLLELSALSVLHVAPEAGLEQRLRMLKGVRYTSVDLEDARAMIRADLTDLPLSNVSFDLVICSHVLEHVPEDRAGIRELERVLRPGGLALLQGPVNYDMETTFEDPTVTDEAERQRLFSQHDHVRVYGRDFEDRLIEAGFGVDVYDPALRLPRPVALRYGLLQPPGPLRNDLYACRKMATRDI